MLDTTEPEMPTDPWSTPNRRNANGISLSQRTKMRTTMTKQVKKVKVKAKLLQQRVEKMQKKRNDRNIIKLILNITPNSKVPAFI